MVVVGGGEVEGGDPPGERGVVLQAGPLGGLRVGALDLGDLDVPSALGGRPLEGEGQGGGVTAVGADVDVHCRAKKKLFELFKIYCLLF